MNDKLGRGEVPKGAIFMDRCGDQLGALEFEVTDISASGDPDFPLLRIRTGITFLHISTTASSRFQFGRCH